MRVVADERSENERWFVIQIVLDMNKSCQKFLYTWAGQLIKFVILIAITDATIT